ncbi:hypothetical protein FRX31_002322 [Thalictrum thalictroides]|uniref:Uncharacterized protein n=1 Tax=Thalictrum thalictroides TaxID=46969 RepID=A0A7J6XE57_THATH|nr:hypothetical protein FRX31_002322 [Thalictrum thalictroides]
MEGVKCGNSSVGNYNSSSIIIPVDIGGLKNDKIMQLTKNIHTVVDNSNLLKEEFDEDRLEFQASIHSFEAKNSELESMFRALLLEHDRTKEELVVANRRIAGFGKASDDLENLLGIGKFHSDLFDLGSE